MNTESAVSIRPTAFRATPLRNASPDPMSDLLSIVAGVTGVSVDDIVSVGKTQSIVEARHMAMAIASTDLRLSSPEIGRMLNRDHSSVLYGIRQHVERTERDPAMLARSGQVRERLGSRQQSCMRLRSRIVTVGRERGPALAEATQVDATAFQTSVSSADLVHEIERLAMVAFDTRQNETVQMIASKQLTAKLEALRQHQQAGATLKVCVTIELVAGDGSTAVAGPS